MTLDCSVDFTYSAIRRVLYVRVCVCLVCGCKVATMFCLTGSETCPSNRLYERLKRNAVKIS